MTGLNKAQIIGNLGQDPEVRYLDNGTAVANFSVATSETWKDKNNGEKVTNTEWHRVTLWRGLAEVAEKYLKKGQKVYISGKIKTRKWEDKDGIERTTTEIIGDDLIMLGERTDSPKPDQNPKPEQQAAPSGPAHEEDDLPF